MGLMNLTIADLFSKAVKRFGVETALVYREDSYTWKELDTLSNTVAVRLQTRGVCKGDHVGIWGQNSAAWLVTFLAVQKLGGICVLLNFNYRQRELIQAMSIGDVRWLCYGDTFALRENPGLIKSACSKFGQDYKDSFDIREEALCLREMLREEQSSPGPGPVELDCMETACMLYTTGTTSDPKCVLHDHYSVVNNAIATVQKTGMNEWDVICMSQPMFHVFTLNASILASLYCGAALCLLSEFSSTEILECIEKNKCTILNGVPTNFLCLLSNQNFKKYSTRSLRLSIIGGANISEAQMEYVRQSFPTVHIMRDYGLTEGCNLCNSDLTDSPKTVSRSVGQAYPNLELAIKDPVTGQILPAGQKGEIVTRGYNVMQGYYCSKYSRKDPPASAIDEDGWLHTGDLGIIDREGYVSLVGRIKDIIIRGGENITPAEVSGEILRYEPILDAVVVGVPHPLLGEEAAACLVLDIPEDYCESELRSLLKVRLARYKIPAFYLIYDSFPMKPNGKIDMLHLKQDAYDKVRKFHEGDERYREMERYTAPV